MEAKMLHAKSLSLAFALVAGVSVAALAKTEKEFISDAIKGDNSEIAMGQLALDKSASEPVKAFGRTLIDDHAKAKTQASTVASQIGVSPPGDMSSDAQRAMTKLQKLTGHEFDQEFARVMVEDHQKDIAEYKNEAASGRGPVQQLAAQTLPTLEKHLQMAKSLSAEK
jgi:putative membrane protein